MNFLDELKVEEGEDDAMENYCNTELDKAEHSTKSSEQENANVH